MFKRLVYAVNTTVNNLGQVFRTKIEFEFTVAFLLTLGGFGAMQYAFAHDAHNLFTPVIVGFAAGALFFLSAIGFVTVVFVILGFMYFCAVGPEHDLSWPRVERLEPKIAYYLELHRRRSYNRCGL